MSLKAIIDCVRCGESKPETDFPHCHGKRAGKVCNSCKRDHSKKWYEANKERANNNTRSGHYRREYGLTLAEVDELKKANPNCNICGVDLSEAITHIDHCHDTGKVRGVLCGNCNRGLGYFKDSQSSLSSAIEYLRRHYGS